MAMPTSQRKVDGGHIPGPFTIPNCIEVRFFFTLPNQKTCSTRCFGSNAGAFVPSAAIANQLFDAIKAHWTTRLAGLMSQNTHFTALSVRDMTSSTNAEWRSTTAQVSGAGTETPMPADANIVLTVECNERGRGAKGRMYFPGWTTLANAAGGTVAAAAQAGLNGFANDIRTELNAVALQWVVAKPARQAYTGLTGASHDARLAHMADSPSAVVQDLEWDTQRRRGL